MLSSSQWSLLVVACFLLLVGHFLRAVRWAYLFSGTSLHRRFDLLLGLAVGYLINSIVPFRVGEAARVWFVSRNGSISFSTVASTVVAERLSDLVVVGVGGLFLLAVVDVDLNTVVLQGAAIMLAAAAALVGLAFAMKRSAAARKLVWHGASVFNDRIRLGFLEFFWSASELILGRALFSNRFLLGTVAMWAAYGASYAVFAHAVNQPTFDVTYSLLGLPLSTAVKHVNVGRDTAALALLVFVTAPVVGVLVYGIFKQYPRIMRVLTRGGRYAWNGALQDSLVVKGRFRTDDEYGYFLASLFSGNNQVATTFGLQAIDDGAVAKLFSGGSDAITALVDVQGKLAIRKFAVGAAGEKLKGQHDWLLLHKRASELPLVDILRERPKDGCYHYDMPLVVPASDFYDFIHTAPIAESRRILTEVCAAVTAFHERHETQQADEGVVRKYLEGKVVANVKAIIDFAKPLLGTDGFTINGQGHSLHEWSHLLDIDWLSKQIERRAMTVVHGDLTIENVIVALGRQPDWYIIDPNPDNIFNTRLIDWAKLMQSVHLGYEGLNRSFACNLDGTSIRIAFTKSQAYNDLHALIEHEIRARFGEQGLREVYFHELVNYLRLTPYKIRQDPKKGLCFFACTCVLLGRYLKMSRNDPSVSC